MILIENNPLEIQNRKGVQNAPILENKITSSYNTKNEEPFLCKECKSGKKLQQAHDLFHQEEYEQASYLYQDVLQTRNDCNEALVGLCTTYYFLGKYEEAVSAAINLPNWKYADFINKFSKKCEFKIYNILFNN